ncbi:MAG: DUF3298 domain-containing protein [Prevotella sp.]|nr:DUF3298 domain-containing protein [Prevotella sp.]
MKKLLIFASALLLMLACNKKGAVQGDAADNTPKIDSVIDSVNTHEGKQDISTSIKIVVPVGNEALTKSINQMIMRVIEGDKTVDSTSIKAMAKYFVNSKAEELKGEADYEGSDPEGPSLSNNVEIKILYENDQVITMGVMQDVYLGGAHGSALFEGVTFDKATGKVLGKNILAQDKLNDVKKAVGQGLESYLKETMGSEYNEAESPLSEYNDKGGKTVELPENGIYIDNDSVVFVYQQYEILPYAFGLPEARLSLKEMKEKGWLEPEFAKTVK